MNNPKEDTSLKVIYKNDDNELINKLEIEERNQWEENENQLNFLYPSLNDPLFIKKLSEKKEFYDTKY